MRMSAVIKRPCRLEPGELRRVPIRPESPLIGFHVCCPRCGFNSHALLGHAGLQITEDDEGKVSFSQPVRCVFCRVLIHLSTGEARLEEDASVRNVRYR